MLVILDNCKGHLPVINIWFKARNISNNEALTILAKFLAVSNKINESLFMFSISYSLVTNYINEHLTVSFISEVHKIGISFFYKRHIFIYLSLYSNLYCIELYIHMMQWGM